MRSVISGGKRLGQVLALRLLSGGLNLLALLLLGQRLELSTFGFYSTFVATVAVFVTITFGPLLFSIVSQHAPMRERGEVAAYETSVVLAAFALALVILGAGGVSVALGFLHWPEILLVVSFGLFKIFQELQRTKQLLRLYTVCAVTQSALFFTLCYASVDEATDFRGVIVMLALSNFAGLLIAVLFAKILYTKPQLSHLRGVFITGLPYTVSTVAENTLFLGLRFLLLMFGQDAHLGVFSFCVDLAQRTVGFVINAASFVFVPAAFSAATTGENTKFSNTLAQAGLLAGSVSLVVLGVVLAASLTELFLRLAVEGFSTVIFALVSLAVIVNRLKKLLIDPLAMRYHSVHSMTLGYIVGAVTAITVAFYALGTQLPYAVESANLLGYVTMAVVSYFHLKKRLPNISESPQ